MAELPSRYCLPRTSQTKTPLPLTINIEPSRACSSSGAKPGNLCLRSSSSSRSASSSKRVCVSRAALRVRSDTAIVSPSLSRPALALWQPLVLHRAQDIGGRRERLDDIGFAVRRRDESDVVLVEENPVGEH